MVTACRDGSGARLATAGTDAIGDPMGIALDSLRVLGSLQPSWSRAGER